MANVTLAQAETIIDTVMGKGREAGFKPLTVVVLDAGGHMVAMKRSDNSSIARREIAEGKAYGGLAMGRGSRFLATRWDQAPGFVNAAITATGGKAVPVPGGVVIKDGDAVIGAVGVSGDLSENDEIAAVAGIEAAGLSADTGA